MSVYSKKYGRTFPDRATLQRFDCQQRRCSPMLSWFGLRDSNLDPEWAKEHRPTPQSPSALAVSFGIACAIVFLYLIFSK